MGFYPIVVMPNEILISHSNQRTRAVLLESQLYYSTLELVRDFNKIMCIR